MFSHHISTHKFVFDKHMSAVGLEELVTNIKILKNLQKMLISILECEESQISCEMEKLRRFMKECSITNNFSLYEGFLRIFVHVSIYFFTSKNDSRYHRFYIILDELLSNFSLRNVFNRSTLFFIFKKNKHFILFLYDKGIIDLSMIKAEISSFFRSRHVSHFFPFFIPEIREEYPEFFEKYVYTRHISQKEIDLHYISSGDIENNLETNVFPNSQKIEKKLRRKTDIRNEIHSNEEITQIIREDNLDKFINLVSCQENFDINMNIKNSFLENNDDIWGDNIPCHIDRVNLLDYTLAFGSINIFRYLWLNKANYLQNSLDYAIIGGNFEIIHILEEESHFQFSIDNYIKSLQYHRSEISKYFETVLDIQLIFPQIWSMFLKVSNFNIFHKCFINNETNLAQILTEHMFKKNHVNFYIFHHFICQQPSFDINSNTNVFLYKSLLS
ncbi:hypothetical protein TRFO_16413 [Tritrichomonas foetus]|uniref:DUF3447 domain-containing protein n=1 Tax=Tritrichomonas foetus TaxID=1144522 RepID=A0A1J4KUI9_9EUKA|nr:hypothetical protein TRFO_16413 [Tritrichomonas foetus]|eukprot:OHT13428.1 hypothetical protein TRFO_16413 [Tritrichomonas foetus]